jgi:hypothetical protein
MIKELFFLFIKFESEYSIFHLLLYMLHIYFDLLDNIDFVLLFINFVRGINLIYEMS